MTLNYSSSIDGAKLSGNHMTLLLDGTVPLMVKSFNQEFTSGKRTLKTYIPTKKLNSQEVSTSSSKTLNTLNKKGNLDILRLPFFFGIEFALVMRNVCMFEKNRPMKKIFIPIGICATLLLSSCDVLEGVAGDLVGTESGTTTPALSNGEVIK